MMRVCVMTRVCLSRCETLRWPGTTSCPRLCESEQAQVVGYAVGAGKWSPDLKTLTLEMSTHALEISPKYNGYNGKTQRRVAQFFEAAVALPRGPLSEALREDR